MDQVPHIAAHILPPGLGATAGAGILCKDEKDRTAADRLLAEQRAATALATLRLDGFAVLIDPTEEALAAVALYGADRALLTLRAEVPEAIGATLEIPNAAVTTWTRARAAELVGMRRLDDGSVIENPDAAWAITDGTRELIRADVTRAFAEQWSREDLADHLAESYAFSDARAELIARTEIGRALVQGNVETWKASGVVTGKQWVLGSEHPADDPCDDNAAAGVIPVGEAFPSGDDWPPQHPNCTCDALPVLAGEDTEA